MTKAHTLLGYLMRYKKLYPDEPILLLYRPSADSNWADRCMLYDKKFSPFKQYNHRSMLKNEVVIEFDNEDKEVNKAATAKVLARLRTDGIAYSYWSSGNKSFHVHCLLDIPETATRRRLKKAFLDVYTQGLEVKPDYQLCIDSHLIRAENGLHEKTGARKTLLRTTDGYPSVSAIPRPVWDRYNDLTRASLATRPALDCKLRELPQIKYLLRTMDFGTVGDGRERALFILSQVLKAEYKDSADLVKFLQDWYRYSGGKKLTPQEVEKKVRYQLKRDYRITPRYVDEFLEEIGAKPD